ncbi:FIST C-terminal domain-containing protein [bacterium]|nr:FIST C-terminal domain-containing protein [bacterium]
MKFGIGWSVKKEAIPAAEEAVQQAISCVGEKPSLIILFSSSIFELEKLLPQIVLKSEYCPMIGCTTSGEITNMGISFGSLVVVAVKCEASEGIRPVAVSDICGNERASGSRLAKEIEDVDRDGTLLIFPDGLLSHGTALVKGIQENLDPRIQIIGACAGDDLKRQRTYQFRNGEILTEALTGGLFFINGQQKVSLQHGFYPAFPPMCVTRSKENVIYELDHHRATKVYLESLGLSENDMAFSPVEDLKETKVSPIGIPQISGDYLIKRFLKFGKDGSIACDSFIPQNTIVRIMGQDTNSLIKATRKSAEDIARTIKKPKIIFVFACSSRMLILGEEAEKEIDQIKDVFGKDVPIAGFYGYGEIGSLSARKGTFNNKSVVLWAIE